MFATADSRCVVPWQLPHVVCFWTPNQSLAARSTLQRCPVMHRDQHAWGAPLIASLNTPNFIVFIVEGAIGECI